jgi:hypothetical protein
MLTNQMEAPPEKISWDNTAVFRAFMILASNLRPALALENWVLFDQLTNRQYATEHSLRIQILGLNLMSAEVGLAYWPSITWQNRELLDAKYFPSPQKAIPSGSQSLE